jgi:hypothetical protein
MSPIATAAFLRRPQRERSFLMNATPGMNEFYDSFFVIQDHWKASKGAYVAITNRTRDRFAIHELVSYHLARCCKGLRHG